MKVAVIGDWVVSKGLDGTVWRTPAQISTPFRRRVQQEFWWVGA